MSNEYVVYEQKKDFGSKRIQSISKIGTQTIKKIYIQSSIPGIKEKPSRGDLWIEKVKGLYDVYHLRIKGRKHWNSLIKTSWDSSYCKSIEEALNKIKDIYPDCLFVQVNEDEESKHE